jgi:beta-lactamase superfamily II metal-dependent hydrolase
MFRIEMLPAGHGDSLLVAYGERDDPQYVLIDGGPYYAYRNQRYVERKTLAVRMQELVDAEGQLELLVTTHVDADHIEAAVMLLGDRSPDLVIQDVWFNAWRHLASQPEDLLGPVHGEMLSALIQRQELPWNAAFGGGAVVAGPGAPAQAVTLPGGLRLWPLSPTAAGLAELRGTWAEALREEGLDPDAPDQALERLKASRLRPDDYLGERRPDVERLAEEPFQSDDSPANGSSIAFLAEFEGKRCLLAGDAHPGILERSIQGLLDEWGESRLRLDAFKIPHHGSKANLSPDLLELLDCERYLVSTNGSYFDHPDPEAMARIFLHGGDQPVLCFNYRSKQNAIWDDPILIRDYRYRTVYPDEAHQGLAVEL